MYIRELNVQEKLARLHKVGSITKILCCKVFKLHKDMGDKNVHMQAYSLKSNELFLSRSRRLVYKSVAMKRLK